MCVFVFDYAYLWLIARPLNEHRAVNFVRHDDKKKPKRKKEKENKEEKQTKLDKKITAQMKRNEVVWNLSD